MLAAWLAEYTGSVSFAGTTVGRSDVFTFKPIAVACAVETGLFTSDVLSTWSNHTSALVIPVLT